MNDELHAYWQSYFETLAWKLGLKDWDIRVSRDASDWQCDGDVNIWEGQRRATIRLNANLFRPGTGEQFNQRRVAIHELLHCHAEPLDRVFDLGFPDVETADAPAIATVKRFYVEARERLVDTLASAIAPHLPLPLEWTAK
jgi:hypothetical protein